MKYKYTFDPTSKKFPCPRCDKKKFVRMIDELGNYISDEFGFCERKGSCRYFKYPKKSDSNIKIDYSQRKLVNLTIKDGPPSIIPAHYVQQSLKSYSINSFYQYLTNLFNKERIDAVFNEYKVGTSKKWNGATVFWLISKDFEVRSGKVIKFDAFSGKRIKEPNPLMTWVHSLLKLKQFNLKQVLFGEHLLSYFPKKPICIVESEKTAVIMAIKHPNYLWLATGSKHEFKAEKLKVLIGRKVVIFPDTDAHKEWEIKVEQLSKQLNLDFIVSSYVINCTIALDQSKGYDLADFKQINIDNADSIESNHIAKNKNLECLIKRNPNLSEFIRVFDLYVPDG